MTLLTFGRESSLNSNLVIPNTVLRAASVLDIRNCVVLLSRSTQIEI